jgi:hypothetical protein
MPNPGELVSKPAFENICLYILHGPIVGWDLARHSQQRSPFFPGLIKQLGCGSGSYRTHQNFPVCVRTHIPVRISQFQFVLTHLQILQ